MILYFTGTGNSKYVADAIADRIGDSVLSLNEMIKYGKPAMFESETPFVVVAPIYAWRLPAIVHDFLSKAEFSGNSKVYVVGTMASETGHTDRYCKRLVEEMGLEYMGFSGIAMPNNYVIADRMPSAEQVREQLQSALPKIQVLSSKIQSGENIEKNDKTPLAGLKSGMINRLFVKFASSKNFVVSEKCSSCKKCEKQCPTNNIRMDGGKPVFGKHCINCYACIHHCPTAAIDIKGKTEDHGRYVCPEYRSAN